MTGVISQFSASTGRGCWWATDVSNHRKRWCGKEQERAKNTFICRYSTDVSAGKQTQEMCMCNWAGVRCIQTHTRTHTHLAQLLQAMNPEWGERENGTISPASVIDLLLSTCRHSYECVRVCTYLRYRIHTKPLALLKRLYVSSTPRPPTHTHTHTIWCLLKQAVNSSLPSRELCKKKRCSHLTAWLSPLPQTAAGHVISRPWPVQSWFGDRLIAGS